MMWTKCPDAFFDFTNIKIAKAKAYCPLFQIV